MSISRAFFVAAAEVLNSDKTVSLQLVMLDGEIFTLTNMHVAEPEASHKDRMTHVEFVAEGTPYANALNTGYVRLARWTPRTA
jgi:hypothetical protein